MTKINYHSPLVHRNQEGFPISVPIEQLLSGPKRRKILPTKLMLISTHVGSQNGDTERKICKMRLVKVSKKFVSLKLTKIINDFPLIF